MILTDMDMLQDYEKDARLAAQAFSLAETEIIDPNLRKLIRTAASAAADSQEKFAQLIIKKGDRP
ncbi:spore coat protein [Desulfolucanica intricata]|uniref:spore coat protein n=1 Tax=Desulfolucanica intricata TaxID=1285191 RepID=UPI00082B3DCC|nr:spore coat protein [Desulfolucanica intricata]